MAFSLANSLTNSNNKGIAKLTNSRELLLMELISRSDFSQTDFHEGYLVEKVPGLMYHYVYEVYKNLLLPSLFRDERQQMCMLIGFQLSQTRSRNLKLMTLYPKDKIPRIIDNAELKFFFDNYEESRNIKVSFDIEKLYICFYILSEIISIEEITAALMDDDTFDYSKEFDKMKKLELLMDHSLRESIKRSKFHPLISKICIKILRSLDMIKFQTSTDSGNYYVDIFCNHVLTFYTPRIPSLLKNEVRLQSGIENLPLMVDVDEDYQSLCGSDDSVRSSLGETIGIPGAYKEGTTEDSVSMFTKIASVFGNMGSGINHFAELAEKLNSVDKRFIDNLYTNLSNSTSNLDAITTDFVNVNDKVKETFSKIVEVSFFEMFCKYGSPVTFLISYGYRHTNLGKVVMVLSAAAFIYHHGKSAVTFVMKLMQEAHSVRSQGLADQLSLAKEFFVLFRTVLNLTHVGNEDESSFIETFSACLDTKFVSPNAKHYLGDFAFLDTFIEKLQDIFTRARKLASPFMDTGITGFKDVDDVITSCRAFLSEQSILPTQSNVSLITDLCNSCICLEQKYSKDAAIGRTLNSFRVKLEKVITDLRKEGFTPGIYRCPPPLIALMGAPGHGKSNALEAFNSRAIHYLCRDSPTLLNEFAEAPNKFIFRRDDQKYWEGFDQRTKIITYPDYQAGGFDPNIEPNHQLELIHLISPEAYRVNMAFEGKGKYAASPKLVTLSTNVGFISGATVDRGAIARRTMMYELKCLADDGVSYGRPGQGRVVDTSRWRFFKMTNSFTADGALEHNQYIVDNSVKPLTYDEWFIACMVFMELQERVFKETLMKRDNSIPVDKINDILKIPNLKFDGVFSAIAAQTNAEQIKISKEQVSKGKEKEIIEEIQPKVLNEELLSYFQKSKPADFREPEKAKKSEEYDLAIRMASALHAEHANFMVLQDLPESYFNKAYFPFVVQHFNWVNIPAKDRVKPSYAEYCECYVEFLHSIELGQKEDWKEMSWFCRFMEARKNPAIAFLTNWVAWASAGALIGELFKFLLKDRSQEEKPAITDTLGVLNIEPVVNESVGQQSKTYAEHASKSDRVQRRLNRKFAKVKLDKPAQAQSGAIFNIIPLISKAQYKIQDKTGSLLQQAFCIKDRLFLTVKHFPVQIKEMSKRNIKNYEMYFTNGTTTFKITSEDLSEIIVDDQDEYADYCLMDFSNVSGVPQGRDMTPHWCTEGALTQFVKERKPIPVASINPDGQFYSGLGTAIASQKILGADGKPTQLRDTIKWSSYSKSGFCGQVVFGVGSDSRFCGKIIGIHVAGSEGYGESHCQVIRNIHLKDMIAAAEGTELEKPVTFDGKDVFDVLDEGHFNKTNVLDVPVPSSYPAAVQWKAPCNVNKLEVAQNARLGYNTKFIPTSSNLGLLRICMRSVLENMAMQSSGRYPIPGVLTYKEALFGREGTALEGIDLSTSAGFPYNCTKITKANLIGKYLGNTFTAGDKVYEFSEEVSDSLVSLIEGSIPFNMCVYTDVIKSELLKKEKVLADKGRLVSAANLTNVVVTRILYGNFILWIMENHLDNGVSLGDNLLGDDADILSRRAFGLCGDEASCYAGDYSGYDKNHSGPVLKMCMEEINLFLKKHSSVSSETLADRHDRMRDTLVNKFIHQFHLRGRVLDMWTGSLPSGDPMTSIINSLLNISYLTYCMVRGNSNDLSLLRKYPDFLSIRVLGDDNRLVLNPLMKDVFKTEYFEFMKDFNQIYTDDTKSGDQGDFRKYVDTTLLKRGTRFEKLLSKYVCPLELKTIVEMALWTKKVGKEEIPDIEQAIANVENACRELSLHGDEIWDEWFPKFQKMYQEHSWVPMYVDRIGYLTAVYSSDKVPYQE